MDVTVERKISRLKQTPIKFGTDGWRDVIADAFTVENVRTAAQALCLYLMDEYPSTYRTDPLVVGYDTRFMSDRFARAAAEVASANGFKVLLSDRPNSTPALSWAVKQHHALGAIVITASHNPPKYNGFKIKAAYAGSASPFITSRVENALAKVDTIPMGGEEPQLFDPRPAYFDQLKGLVDIDLIMKADLRIVADPMFGAGSGYLASLLDRKSMREINSHRDPNFGGVNPEPIPQNLQKLSEEVKALNHPLAVGLAFDGDADRIGAIDEEGNFVSSHRILALILRHLVEVKHLTGGVIKTVSTTRMIEKMANRYGLKLFETPIGFKYICDLMQREDILIGGEESGGIGVKNHMPERDGVLCGLYLLEIMATHGKGLKKLIDELEAEYGPHAYSRIDLHLRDNAAKDQLLEGLSKQPPKTIEGIAVTAISEMDGIKFSLENGGWLLFRASGTEPVLRIYSECPTQEEVTKLLEYGRKLAQGE